MEAVLFDLEYRETGELREVSGMRSEIRLPYSGHMSALASYKKRHQTVNGKLLYLHEILEKLSDLRESGDQFSKNRYGGLMDDSRWVFLQPRYA